MFNSKATRIGICGLVCIVILVGMLVKHAWPLWTGQIVYLKVRPVDPRDVFRGDYVTLNYDINNSLYRVPKIGGLKEKMDEKHQRNMVVYVQLKQIPSEIPDVPSIYQAVSVSDKPEPGQINIKGLVPVLFSSNINFGIDAFFVQEGQGQEIERALQDRSKDVVAEIAVSSSGNARIKNLIVDGKRIIPD